MCCIVESKPRTGLFFTTSTTAEKFPHVNSERMEQSSGHFLGCIFVWKKRRNQAQVKLLQKYVCEQASDAAFYFDPTANTQV